MTDIPKPILEVKAKKKGLAHVKAKATPLTAKKTTLELIEAITYAPKCTIVDAIYFGGEYTNASKAKLHPWKYKNIAGLEVVEEEMLKDIRIRLKTGTHPISLGKGGRLLLKFNPPLMQIDSMKPIISFDEELGGEEFHIRLGNELIGEGVRSVQPMEIDGVRSSFAWGKTVRIKSINLSAREETKKFLGKPFQWLMLLDASSTLFGQPINQPGLDIKKLNWECSKNKMIAPEDIAILIDSSGSMADNDAGEHYRSDLETVDLSDDGANQLRVVSARGVRQVFLNDGALYRKKINFWVSLFKGKTNQFFYHDKDAPARGLGNAVGASPDVKAEIFSRWRINIDNDDNMEYGHVEVKRISGIALPSSIDAQSIVNTIDTLSTWGEGIDITCGGVNYDWITDSIYHDYTPIKSAIVDNARVLLAQRGTVKLMIVITDGEGTEPNETWQATQNALNYLSVPTDIASSWIGIIELIGYNIYPSTERIPFFNFNPINWTVHHHEVLTEAQLRVTLSTIRNKYIL